MDQNPSKRKVRGRFLISGVLGVVTIMGVFMLKGSSAVYAVQPVLTGAIITPAQSQTGI